MAWMPRTILIVDDHATFRRAARGIADPTEHALERRVRPANELGLRAEVAPQCQRLDGQSRVKFDVGD